MDSDTLADISCSDGDVPKWDGVVGQWDCGLDNDTLSNLNCSAGELAKFDGSNWSCGEDIDTVLDADTVISYVEQNSLSIPPGSQIDGENIVTQPTVCNDGQILIYNTTNNDWECGDDTDTTLTSQEMQIMIEALSLNLQNIPQVNGSDVLTVNSILNTEKLDVGTGTEGQVLTVKNSVPSWEDNNTETVCPIGFYDLGFSCIEETPRTLTVFDNAWDDCVQSDYRLCGVNEGRRYCRTGLATGTPQFSSIWTSDWYTTSAIYRIDESSCNVSWNNPSGGDTNYYRCCVSK